MGILKGSHIRRATLAFLLIMGLAAGKIAMADTGYRVLFLSSYHPGFPTFFQQLEGILSELAPHDIVVDVEFMDSKRFPNADAVAVFRDSLEYKLSRLPAYDAILPADDNALRFILETRDLLFPNIPVVFMGINDRARALAQNNHPEITGVVEAVSMGETIELMARLQPQVRNIVALVDATPSGQGDLKRFYVLADQFPTLAFSHLSLSEMSWDAFAAGLASLGEGTSVLLLSAFRDKTGEGKRFDKSLALILGHLSRPLFHLWRHGIGQGMVGGKVISHREQGRVAAGMVLEILNGRSVAEIPVEKLSPNQYVLDYTALKRHNLDFTMVPEESLILNRPHSMYRENQLLFWGVGTVILFLSFSLFFAVFNLRRRRQMETWLRTREIHLRTVIENLPDLVWFKDPDGVYMFCNLRLESMFGAKESEIKGRTDYDFVDKELAEFFRAKDEQAIQAGGPTINEEEVVFASDGHTEILETVKTPVYGVDGQLLGVLGIARDITERKQAEGDRKKLEAELRQAHKMEAIGTLSGGIAHDFNNILGIIIGNSELALEQMGGNDPVRNRLEEIKKAGLRAGDIVRQLLHYSRKTNQEKQLIDVRELVDKAYHLLRSSIPTSVDIRMDLAVGVSPIQANATQIHQILINLCTNASHAMEEEGGVITIALSDVALDRLTVTQFEKLVPGRYVQLSVTDTGQGIAPADHVRIFDPYFTTKAMGKGTGMGLAVVMGIVKNHNGGISVDSRPGAGSCFSVLLPAADGVVEENDGGVEVLPRGDEEVLFVDDEPALVYIGKRLLSTLGYRVEISTDPLAALDMVKADPGRFALVITDMTMPRMSGERLMQEIRALNPAIKILLCTGFSNRINAEKALKMGADGYMEKPIVRHRLAQDVRHVLDDGGNGFSGGVGEKP